MILSMLVVLAAFSTAALAETWSGKLLDAKCYSEKNDASMCEATGETTAFSLNVAGKVYRLDGAGNSKAADALKNRADRVQDPSKPGSKEVMAEVEGTLTGDTISVSNIEIQ
jgi:hypothetical protein